MAQRKFGNCLNEFIAAPTPIPPDLGFYTVEKRPRCIGEGEVRRRDVTVKYGEGVARVDTTAATDNFAGLAGANQLPMELIPTEQGPIALPFGQVRGPDWMPTSLALDAIPSVDTRMTLLSDRYYK